MNYSEIMFRCLEKQSKMAGRHIEIDNNRKQLKKEQAMVELY